MICSACRTENPEGAVFCMGCGAPLGAAPPSGCPSCGTSLPGSAKFCFSCGAPVEGNAKTSPPPAGIEDALRRLMPREYVDQLAATRGRVSGERRVITILFCDVHGSVALAEHLDPEEVMDIMNGALETLIEPVFRHEGTLARLMGDAVLAFFGAPIAHEDDPERACRAASDMIEGAKRYGEKLEGERGISGFQVRVGINTGLVVVGEVGSDLRVEYTAMGDAVNLAARMESAARPGTILLTGATAGLVKRVFDLEDVGPLAVKGKSAPVPAFRLLGARRGATEAEAHRSPLVGRQRELGALLESIEDLASGRGGTVAIEGEAGVGKSRLVEEARRRASPDAPWVDGRCASYGEGTGAWPVRSVLAQMLGADPEGPREERETALRVFLGDLRPEEPPGGALSGEELRSCLARLLDIPLTAEEEGRFDHLGADLLRERLFEGFRFVVARTASRRPLVIVWEDIHWMDSSTAGFLEALAPLGETAPVLQIFLFRPGEGRIGDARARLESAGGDRHRTIEIAPLSKEESARLIDRLLPPSGITAETRGALLRGAEGNPFFLEEMAGALAESGGPAPSEAGPVTLPGTVQGVIMARIDRLPPATKRVLQTASVLGRTFPRTLLAPLAGEERDGPVLGEAIDLLCRRGFLLPPGAGEGDGFTFKHAITADVAYNSLLRRERRELHRRAGNAIEGKWPDRKEEMTPALAHHFERGGVPVRAFAYLNRAARGAVRVSANPEAIAYLERAITLARGGDPGLGDEDLASASADLGDVHYRMGDFKMALDAYDRALAGAREAGLIVALHRRRGRVFEKWGRCDEAKESFETGLRAVGPGVEPGEVARIYAGLAVVHAHRSRLEEAARMGAVALKMMKSLGDEWGTAQACNNLGVIHGKRGAWEAAIRHLARCRSICEKTGETYGLASCLNNLGLVYGESGDGARAAEHFRESVRLFERLGNRQGLARAYENLARVLEEGESAERAAEYARRSREILSDIGGDGSDSVPEMWQSGAW
ncbi:MAG: tetratricopeptide repeat protein [Candidatus Eisenbacteria bacterium]